MTLRGKYNLLSGLKVHGNTTVSWALTESNSSSNFLNAFAKKYRFFYSFDKLVLFLTMTERI